MKMLVDLGKASPGRNQIVLDLQGVTELDPGFHVFLFGKIILSAFIIILRPLLARAARGELQCGQDEASVNGKRFEWETEVGTRHHDL
jgi:hypothetical protein